MASGDLNILPSLHKTSASVILLHYSLRETWIANTCNVLSNALQSEQGIASNYAPKPRFHCMVILDGWTFIFCFLKCAKFIKQKPNLIDLSSVKTHQCMCLYNI